MNRRIGFWLLVWIAAALLAGCANDRNVVKTPVPPPPPPPNRLTR